MAGHGDSELVRPDADGFSPALRARGPALRPGQAKKLTPITVASLILGEAKKIAEGALGDEVDGAVITVPAHFNHAQRSATKEAAELAGLRCDRIINEPTAAALAYGHKKTDDRIVLVYDLGGGTFDVSILQYEVSIVETKSTVGDTRLGGEDFDEVLLIHILEYIKKTHSALMLATTHRKKCLWLGHRIII